MLDGREHGGIIIADGRHVLKARAVYTRVLTAANTHTYCVSSVERCLPRYLSKGGRPKYQLVRQHMPPRFHPAL